MRIVRRAEHISKMCKISYHYTHTMEKQQAKLPDISSRVPEVLEPGAADDPARLRRILEELIQQTRDDRIQRWRWNTSENFKKS